MYSFLSPPYRMCGRRWHIWRQWVLRHRCCRTVGFPGAAPRRKWCISQSETESTSGQTASPCTRRWSANTCCLAHPDSEYMLIPGTHRQRTHANWHTHTSNTCYLAHTDSKHMLPGTHRQRTHATWHTHTHGYIVCTMLQCWFLFKFAISWSHKIHT
jgi:hypothetical protein